MTYIKKILFVLTLAVSAEVATAQMQMPPIPVDPDVRIGRLDNGLTYYIRHNNWPENRAEFYIAQKVGSIQEDDNQRGLAHFLEHMAFNGSKHFRGNELLRWCESIGVKFGTDLNAYTSIDQTVYNISNVPTTRESIVDSCLMILWDWADGLLLEQDEIEKERGVIHEEWRLRSSAQQRMLERDLPKLYPGSKYGYRMPIGLMEIIDNFERPFLQQYYEKWYRPDNQGIIVVGDVNVDQVEQKIKTMFSQIAKPGADAAQVKQEDVPDNATPIVVIDKDKEQRYNIVEVLFKHEAIPDSAKGSLEYLVANYLKSVALGMLNGRLGEIAEKPDCPFLQAQVEDGTYLLSKPKDAFTLAVVPKDGMMNEALTTVFVEARRAAEFGFTQTEYGRSKANTLSALDKQYSNKDKRYNSQFVNQYVRHFLANEPIPSIDDYYQLMKQLVPAIPVEAVNQVMKQLMPQNDSNMVVLSFNQEKADAVYPTEDGLLAAVSKARGEELTAWVDNVKDEPLMTTLPTKGSIKKEVRHEKFLTKTSDGVESGYSELTLSNGVKVILKHTDLKKDQVLLLGEGWGGSSLYSLDDRANIALFNDAVEASGLGAFSHTELTKALAGKIAGATLTMSTQRTNVNGSSTPTDVETMLQLVHLYMTGKVQKDQQSFDQMMKTTELQLKNRLLQPEAVFSDSLTLTMSCHNPRFKSLTVDDLQQVDYDRILAMAKERTQNAAAFTFTIIGNYNDSTIRPLIEQYIASLPVQKKIVKGKDVATDYKGKVVNNFKHKAETPKSIAVLHWYSKEVPYTLENAVRAKAVGQVLQMVYLKEIREEASAAYTVSAQASASRDDFGDETMILAYCPMKPEKADTAITIMRRAVEDMAAGKCNADMVTKVKEYMLKNHGDRLKTNGYWAGAITTWRKWGLDFYTSYEQTVQSLTPASLCTFVREVLKAGNQAEVVMLPAE
ncbi:MAG: insulinase family protein [Prevotella sp.]|nr:insulinase family protein [Prevotella sp.]